MNHEIRAITAIAVVGTVPQIVLLALPTYFVQQPVILVFVYHVWMFALQIPSLYIPILAGIKNMIEMRRLQAMHGDHAAYLSQKDITVSGILKNHTSRDLFKQFMAKQCMLL